MHRSYGYHDPGHHRRCDGLFRSDGAGLEREIPAAIPNTIPVSSLEDRPVIWLNQRRRSRILRWRRATVARVLETSAPTGHLARRRPQRPRHAPVRCRARKSGFPISTIVARHPAIASKCQPASSLNSQTASLGTGPRPSVFCHPQPKKHDFAMARPLSWRQKTRLILQ